MPDPCFPKELAREVPLPLPAAGCRIRLRAHRYSGRVPAEVQQSTRFEPQFACLHDQGCTLTTIQPLFAPASRSDRYYELK